VGFACSRELANLGEYIIIGKDNRPSSDMLEAAVTAGICSAGINVIKLSIIPTSAIPFFIKKVSARGGVMISASHNPSEYNGIKFFNSEGFKLDEKNEAKIEEEIDKICKVSSRPSGKDIGRVTDRSDLINSYINFLIQLYPLNLKGFKIAIDCANGVTGFIAPEIYKRLGATLYVNNDDKSGENINYMCGSTFPENISNIVRKIKADVGFAFDGDGDRLIVSDEKGNILDGEFIMAIIADFLKSERRLIKDILITTKMANLGFIKAMSSKGIKVLTTDVGDKFVLQEMLETGATIGGEQSGHIILLDKYITGDGILTSLALLDVLINRNEPLSELSKIMEKNPQVLINVEVKDKSKLSQAKHFWEKVKEFEKVLDKDENKGRILVRPSGTESVIRIMVESTSEKLANSIAKQLASLINF
jgi:phosphoglucosamine mutase